MCPERRRLCGSGTRVRRSPHASSSLHWFGPARALGAGGAPLPAPDDPPSSQPAGSVKAPAAKTSTAPNSGTDEPTRVADAAVTPDARIRRSPRSRDAHGTCARAARPLPRRRRPSRRRRPNRPRPQRRAAPTRETRDHPDSGQAQAEAEDHAAPVPRRTTPATAASARTTSRRLGLPARAARPGRGRRARRVAALLVAAALLLAASGAGSLTVGLSVRRLARGA